mgnify:CR=1 FL=1
MLNEDIALYAGFGLERVVLNGKHDADYYTEYLNEQVHEVVYERTIKAKKWSTLWLPFAIDVEKQEMKGRLYTLANANIEDNSGLINVILTFHKNTSGVVCAGEPCLYYSSTEIPVSYSYYDVFFENLDAMTISVGEGVYKIKYFGTTKNVLLGGSSIDPNLNKSYRYLSDNVLYYPSSNGVNMETFRGYFQIDDYNYWYGSSQLAPRLHIVADGQEINESEEEGEDSVSKYIDTEGNLIIQRGGNKYDAQGRLLD